MLRNFRCFLRSKFINKGKLNHCRRFANVVSSPQNSEKLENSVVIKNLFDRYLLSCTFPDSLAKNLKEFDKFPPIVYAGFDPTSASLHVGNLLVLTNLLHLYSSGFDVIVLIGGATSKLGDPSGRETDRPSLEWPVIVKNSEALLHQIESVFSNFTQYIFKGNKNDLKPVRFVNNAKWYSNLNVISFLDRYGRLFRMTDLLEKSAIRKRLVDTGLNVNEFLYQIFQAFDFLRLYEEFGCLIQLGGSDQVGNVHSGHDLIQNLHDKNAVGIFSNILTSSDGKKLGKSEGNASINLNANLTSPFEFYQYFMRLPDAEVQKYFYLFTFLPLQHVDSLYDKHMKHPEKRMAQTKLAEQVTLLVHGEKGLSDAIKASQVLYENKIDHLLDMTHQEIEQCLVGVPMLDLNFKNGMTLMELVNATARYRSEHKAAEIIAGGGVYINLLRIQDPNCVLVRGTHVLPNKVTVLRFGRRDYFIIRWKDYE